MNDWIFRTAASRLWIGLVAFAILGLVEVTCARAQEAGRLPNFVLIFTDDQGYKDVGCYGAEKLETPNLDKMATEGMRFTQFYVNCPVCSGSRAALMTGCYFPRVSVSEVYFPGSKQGLHPNETTIAEVLKPLGYATVCIGKWHLGHKPPFLPTRQGFDAYYGIPYSNDMWIDPKAKLATDVQLGEGWTVERIRGLEKPPRNVVPLMRDEEVIEFPADQATLTKRYTEEAIRFMREHRDEPFFVYLPHTMCHAPLHASEPFRGKSQRGVFGDVIRELDWSVGEILNAIEELGLGEKTLVIFTCDNGPAHNSAAPLRGRKGSLYEGGYRVPCIMRWPGTIPKEKVCDEVAASIDLLPTLAALAGAKPPQDRVIDGKDVRPLIMGEPGAKSPHDVYIVQRGKRLAVRSGRWKFYPWPEGAERRRRPNQPQKPVQGPLIQLYDLTVDVSEQNNLAEQNPDVVAKLTEVAERYRQDIRQNRRPAGQWLGE